MLRRPLLAGILTLAIGASGASLVAPAQAQPASARPVATGTNPAADLSVDAAADRAANPDANLAANPAAKTGANPAGFTRVEGTALPAFRVGVDAPRRVPLANRPYAYVGRAALRNPGRPHDRSGIVMYSRGAKLHNHPVLQASHALTWIGSYRNSRDARYLTQSVRTAERMLSYSVRSRGALYLPYPFDFALHGKEQYTLKAPWYSAMAQGEALSMFVGLYEITGEKRWKDAADATFASFLLPKAPGVPWTVEVDDKGLLWFEEYVGTHTDRAYNGHNFALFGVYDYWWLTRDPRARQVFLGGLQATRVHAAGIRVPGRTSRYCLAHDVFSSTYHDIHISQLYRLYELTGSTDLARLADAFQADAPGDYQAGDGHLVKGRHTVVTRGADGRVTSTVRTGPRSAENARIGQRTWMARRAGVWLRIDSGALKGRWVLERPGVAYVRGVRDAVTFRPARVGVLPAGTRVGYAVDSAGRVVARRTVRLSKASPALMGGRQTRDGRTYLQVSNGAFKGLLIPAAGVRLI